MLEQIEYGACKEYMCGYVHICICYMHIYIYIMVLLIIVFYLLQDGFTWRVSKLLLTMEAVAKCIEAPSRGQDLP